MSGRAGGRAGGRVPGHTGTGASKHREQYLNLKYSSSIYFAILSIGLVGN